MIAAAFLQQMKACRQSPSGSLLSALSRPRKTEWQGRAENTAKAQQALLKRARLNSLARQGRYLPEMEAAG